MTAARRNLVLLLSPASLVGFAMAAATVTMAAISLQGATGASGPSLSHYLDFFQDRYFLNAGLRTFLLSITVTAVCLVCGYPVAWFLVHGPARIRKAAFVVVLTPLLVSIVVRTLGWTILLGNEGVINHAMQALGLVDAPIALMRSFWTVVAGMVHVFLPFMILSIASTLGSIDPGLPEAAALLGANPAESFRSVTLPLSAQGIASGSIIVFCLSTGVFLTPLWLSRGSVSVMATVIKEQVLDQADAPSGAATAIILTVATLAVVASYNLLLRRYERR